MKSRQQIDRYETHNLKTIPIKCQIDLSKIKIIEPIVGLILHQNLKIGFQRHEIS